MNRLNLSLTDELRAFFDASSGDGTLLATPREFLGQVLREKKERIDDVSLREGILEGFQDLAAGRYVEFKGGLDQVLNEFN